MESIFYREKMMLNEEDQKEEKEGRRRRHERVVAELNALNIEIGKGKLSRKRPSERTWLIIVPKLTEEFLQLSIELVSAARFLGIDFENIVVYVENGKEKEINARFNEFDRATLKIPSIRTDSMSLRFAYRPKQK